MLVKGNHNLLYCKLEMHKLKINDDHRMHEITWISKCAKTTLVTKCSSRRPFKVLVVYLTHNNNGPLKH